jgi:hypothetical protein
MYRSYRNVVTRSGAMTRRTSVLVRSPSIAVGPEALAAAARRLLARPRYAPVHHDERAHVARSSEGRIPCENEAADNSPAHARLQTVWIAREWSTARATIGWLAPDRNENWVHTEAKPSVSTMLPAFRFNTLERGLLNRLRPPQTPFAIVLDGVVISDAALKGIARFNTLHALHVSRPPLTDVALNAVRGAIGLRVLYLRGTKVTDAGVKELTELRQLQFLRLSGTGITDAAMGNVARLDNLRRRQCSLGWLQLRKSHGV